MSNARPPIVAFCALSALVLLGACSGEPKPDTSNIEQAVRDRLPPFVHLAGLTIDAMENAGTKVEPQWQARFHGSIKLAAPTFAADGSDGEVTFVRAQKREGEARRLFGKSISRLYAGVWRTTIDLEGSPIESLGQPESAFGPGRVIVRDSAAETAYREQRQRMLADSPQKIIGAWRYDERTVEFHPDGVIIWLLYTHQRSQGTWAITGDAVTLDGRYRWRIIRIDDKVLRIQSTAGEVLEGARVG